MHSKDKIQSILQTVKKLNRLTVLRTVMDESEFKSFYTMLTALVNEDILAAEKAYHKLTSQLLASGARRISGNIFTDYIITWITENENVFSLNAALGKSDPIIIAAMEQDLDTLLDIAKLHTGDISTWFSMRNANANDMINAMSSAIWNGQKVTNIMPPQSNSLPPEATNCTLFPWEYVDAELYDAYVCDLALIPLYTTCMTENASTVTEELYRFFETYGTGTFIKKRVLNSNSKTLISPIDENVLNTNFLPFICDSQRNAVIDTAIDFLRDTALNHMLICGERDAGKTTILLSLINELPDANLIYISGHDICNLSELFATLNKQPLKFILLIDDADNCTKEITRALCSFEIPDNVLIIATSETDALSFVFDISVNIAMPDLAGIAKYIYDTSTVDTDISRIRNLCMNYQIETQKPLSYKAIKHILNML